MKKEIILTISGICCIAFLLFGFMLGIQTQTLNMIKIGESIQIEEINIDLNETQMTESMMNFFEKRGLFKEIQQRQKEKQTNG